MALLVWLPLNGNLNNKGLSDIEVTNNGATVNNNGKIGKCYEFNIASSQSGTKYMGLSKNVSSLFQSGSSFSLACFVKVSGDLYSNGCGVIESAVYKSSGFSLDLRKLANGKCRLGMKLANNGEEQEWASGVDIDKNIWYHICGTFDSVSNKLSMYLDGSLCATLTVTNLSSPWIAANTPIRIGIGTQGGWAYTLPGYLNDVRIYNHCLSPKEVHEVAKGLVLHYKLDDPEIEKTINLARQSTNYSTVNEGQAYAASKWGGDDGTITYYRSGGYNNGPYKVYHKTATGTGGIHKKLGDDIHILSGHTYTMSVYVKASRNLTDSAHSFNINRTQATPYSAGNRYITYNKQVPFTTEWTRLERTFTATDADAGDYGEMSILYNDDVADYYVYYSCFQIEENDHATPYVDGYRNLEGTINLLDYSNLKGHGSSWELQSSTFDGNPIYRNTVTSPNVGNNAGFSIKNSIYESRLATATKITISFYKKLNAVYGKNLGGYIRVVKSDDTEGAYTWSYNKANWANDENSIGIWDYITATVTIPSGCKYIKLCYVYTDNATGGNCDFANIQLELKDHATPYVNGTRLENPNLAPELVPSNYTQQNYGNRTSSTISDGIYHVTGYQSDTSIDTSFSITSNSFIVLTPNTDYYLSFWCKAKAAGDLHFGTHTQAYTVLVDESNNRYFPESAVIIGKDYDGPVILNFHTGDATQYKLKIGFDTPNIYGIGSFIEFSDIVLSYLSHIHDFSGCDNSSIIVGDLATNTISPRYSRSTKFSTTSYIRSIKRPAEFLPKDAITVNLWTKFDTWAQNPISCTESGGWNFENASGSGVRFPVYVASVGYKTANSGIPATSLAGSWHMLTGTFDSNNVKIYIDGELKGTTAVGSSNGISYYNNYLFIGAEAHGDSESPAYSLFAGNISDLRIYATALSADDVKELYNVGAWIDNKGNLGGYIDDETTSSPKVEKTGKIISTNFVEYGDRLKALDDGSLWLKILHHNNPSANLFTTANCWQYDDGVNLYSALGILKTSSWTNSNGEYEFLACEKLTSSSTEAQYRWKQTNNPATSNTLSGYEVVSGNPPRTIGLVNKGTYACFHNGSVWWCACGSYTDYGSGIPGFGGKVTNGYIDLYIRINNIETLKGLQENKTAFYKDSILTNQLIEI